MTDVGTGWHCNYESGPGFRLPEPDSPWDLSAMTLDESFHDSMPQFSVL